MSRKGKVYKIKNEGLLSFLPSALLTALIFIIALYLSSDLSVYVKDGISLSVNVIIPSVFPFLIFSDFFVKFIQYERVSKLRHIFERVFKINGVGVSAYILGLLCGYPIGAKIALAYYENGIIEKEECERLMAFSNNASPGYIISAVGGTLLGSIKKGVLLYLITVLSSAISGVISGINKRKSEHLRYISEQNYNFFKSVKSAIYTSISTGGFITVFSIFFGLIHTLLKSDITLALISPFLEISNACSFLSELCIFPPFITFALISLSISFSGLCVGAQALALIPDGLQINAKRYFKLKLLQGVIAFIISLPIYILFI